MAYLKQTTHIDVTAAMPEAAQDGEPVTIAITLVADPAKVASQPVVVVAIPGGTYHRRYWDLQPPGRSGYSQAEWMADRGVIFVASDYLGGGDSSRPADGDFMTLEVAADAAHAVYRWVRAELEAGSIYEQLAPAPDATYVGVGQSLGGFITMIQQGKYADYGGVAILGASPIVIANIPHHRHLEGLSPEERRRAILEDNATSSGVTELPMYHGASRDILRDIFHVKDVHEDLVRYDEDACHTLISRVTGVDGMTPGYAKPFAEAIESPVFLGWGDVDVSSEPHARTERLPSVTPRHAVGRGEHGPHAQLRRHPRTALGGPPGVAPDATRRRTMTVERFPVEAGHIMLFARAIGDPNPEYHGAMTGGGERAGAADVRAGQRAVRSRTTSCGRRSASRGSAPAATPPAWRGRVAVAVAAAGCTPSSTTSTTGRCGPATC